ncbi:hypothetical protein ADIAG_00492 [Paeniglutamicibacter gangotriensis Lz1y]|uniref:Uncharacterized protein n=1 Tax=Paeniglutamicibacter gangotriensis Lz1y TaxID=1276920 RepID=M7NF83_9MICC|nr:hypothetical protein ADIAG_00492 [Paeniglutamicibacter gangotriensis Lz1y]
MLPPTIRTVDQSILATAVLPVLGSTSVMTAVGFAAGEKGTLLATSAQNLAELGRQSVQSLAGSLAGKDVAATVAVTVDTVIAENTGA